MTVTQMECFIRLADSKKLTTVANAMSLQASTLSKYIDHMEDTFSTKLFSKTTKGLELTQEGKLIYPSLQYIVKTYSDMMALMDNKRKISQRNINIAIAFHQPHLLADLISFSKMHSELNLVFTESPSAEIWSGLDSLKTDVAITYSELTDKKYEHIFPLRRDRLVAAVSKKHPLAGRSHISISELSDDRFLLLKDDVPLHKFLVRMCITAGFVPKEGINDFRVNTIVEYVARNQGVTLLSEYVVRNLHNDNISVLYLDDNPTLTLSLIYPDHYMNPVIEQLVEFLKTG